MSGASKVLEQANIEKAKVLQKEEGEIKIKGGAMFFIIDHTLYTQTTL